MARLVAYCRVSTDGQADNSSLENQRVRIEGYCVGANHSIVAHFEDVETASGKRVRPNFQAALDMVYSDRADGLVCMRLDRFARSTMEGLQVASALQKAGKQLAILDLNLDTSTPAGRCIFVVLLAFAELERETIAERCQTGRKATAEAGGFAYGRPPYGWRSAPTLDGKYKRLVPVPEEQAIRRLAAEWRNAGMSYQSIADELNLREIPSKTGKRWAGGSVHLVLKGSFKMAHLLTNGSETVDREQVV